MRLGLVLYTRYLYQHVFFPTVFLRLLKHCEASINSMLPFWVCVFSFEMIKTYTEISVLKNNSLGSWIIVSIKSFSIKCCLIF